MKLPVATRLVMLTHGVYSGFTVDGFYLIPDDVDLDAERDIYREKFAGDYESNKGFPEFDEWIVAEGKAAPIKYEEFHVSEYGVHYDWQKWRRLQERGDKL